MARLESNSQPGKIYSPPRLTVYGSVRDLTGATSGGNGDGGQNMMA